MIERAAAAEQQIMGHLRKGGNYTKLEAERRFYYGYLGEYAFEKLLIEHGIKYEFSPRYDGKRDRTDFVVFVKQGTPVDVDVKTATGKRDRFLMIPTAQLQSHPNQAYVGVRLMAKSAQIYGTCIPSALRPINKEVYGLKIPTHGVELTRLNPIEKVLAQCDKASLQSSLFND